eukprot:TRINITY_DN3405_c0_g1_i2.p1 TRINITY_DN3405_c0_g1~~TRINITY_DN3405_c0_g1_i2.p1  ORF type:complete len:241 (-),score=52.02 TRINITY_DN3405_c0_g1_i2:207-929(-)
MKDDQSVRSHGSHGKQSATKSSTLRSDDGQQNNTQKIAALVTPTTLSFYIHEISTHRRVLTIYNIFESPIHFKIMALTPSNYNISLPSGTIPPKSSADIVVRLCDVTLPSQTDKLKVVITDTVKKVETSKIVSCIIISDPTEISASSKRLTSESHDAPSLQSSTRQSQGTDRIVPKRKGMRRIEDDQQRGFNIAVLLPLILGIVALIYLSPSGDEFLRGTSPLWIAFLLGSCSNKLPLVC